MNPPTETYAGHLETTKREALLDLHHLLETNAPLLGVPTGKAKSPTQPKGPAASLLGVPPTGNTDIWTPAKLR